MKFLILFDFCILPICCVNAKIGLLLIKTSADSEPIEQCATYNDDGNYSNVPNVPWNNWHEIVDIYPDYGCSESQSDYFQKYVMLKRGNCTFAEKLLLAVNANGSGVLVVSDVGIDTPYLDPNITANVTTITVVLISNITYNLLLRLQNESGVEKVRVLEYIPEVYDGFDPNSVLLFFIAVGTLALGAWWKGIITLADAKNSAQRSAPMPSGVKSSLKNDASHVSLTPSHVIAFFMVCSVSILLLYFFYDYLVYFVIAIFCYASCLSLFDLSYSILSQWPGFVRFRVPPNKLPFFKSRPPVFGILLFIVCASISVVWAVFRKESFAWILQDILGCGFCVFMIKTIKISSGKISVVLLMLFFLYDIFYVFGSKYLTKDRKSVMVEIATGKAGKANEELPMLLKLPKFITSALAQCLTNNYSLLGFGDIILPGLHIGFCASFDAISSLQNSVKQHVYYISGLVAYSVGLIITLLVVNVAKIGQPALLYLVPCCLATTFAVAIKKNQLHYIWTGKKCTEPTLDESHSLLDINDTHTP